MFASFCIGVCAFHRLLFMLLIAFVRVALGRVMIVVDLCCCVVVCGCLVVFYVCTLLLCVAHCLSYAFVRFCSLSSNVV